MDFDEMATHGRRQFIKRVGAIIGGSVLLQSPGSAAVSNYQPTALTADEMATLLAVLSRLLPADESGGGAVEARAHVYIDHALSTAYAKQLPAYHTGLASIKALALKAGASSPSALPSHQLDAILTRMETGKVTEALTDPAGAPISLGGGGAPFFNTLLQHMREGVFGDPGYGGNYEYLGWHLIGYSGIQLYYSEAEQAIDGPMPRGNRSAADFGEKFD